VSYKANPLLLYIIWTLCVIAIPSSARSDDATQCISSYRHNMANGWIPWGVINSCDIYIDFDFDNCNPDPDSMQPVCALGTKRISPHGRIDDQNYHQPANARNYRSAGSPSDTGSQNSDRIPATGGQPAACPDHYFRSQTTGECVYCDAIWSEGRCIYD
jgi:hypothetical protein